MAKFANIVRGTRAEQVVECPPINGALGTGEPIRCIVRPLNGHEEATVLERAAEFAKARKATRIEPGEPLYDLGLAVHTLLLACLDIDSPNDTRAPFFADADEILTWYGREQIAYLYERQQAWQDECAPTIARVDPAGWVTGLIRLGGESESDARRFFTSLRPGMQWSFMRTSAVLLRTAPDLKSLFGGTSGEAGASEKPETPSDRSTKPSEQSEPSKTTT